MKAWKRANWAKVEVFSKDCIFHMMIFYWFTIHFHTIFQIEYQIWAQIWHNMIKTQLFLHQALHYNQIYNFTLKHDYKFKTIIMFKDVWISNFKRYMFFFFECFEHMDPFLWNILKFTKIEMIWWTFDNEEKNLKQKRHLFACISWVFWTYKNDFWNMVNFYENFLIAILNLYNNLFKK